MTDWGAHMIDIAQWGIGMDRNGPVEIIPGTESSPLTYFYPNGIKIHITPFDEGRQGVKFFGENGWIKVSRGQYDTNVASSSSSFSMLIILSRKPSLPFISLWIFLDSSSSSFNDSSCSNRFSNDSLSFDVRLPFR